MIQVSHLQKKFDRRGIAGLSNVSLKLQKSEIGAILGPNGSGKSTLIKTILGDVKLDSGEILVDGKIHFLKIPASVPEINVQQFLIDKVDSSVPEDKKIQLTRDFADLFEFTFQLKQNLHELSTGQKQKILVAGELINSPEIILMDEPFAHLDPFSRREILSALFSYLKQKEMTCLWITHEINEATRFSDKVGILYHGQLEQWDSPNILLEKPRTLFAAKFLGHSNFLMVKKNEKGWSTPWGNFSSNFSTDKSEALLVIPPTEWNLDPDSSFKLELTEVFPENLRWNHLLKKDEQAFEFSSLKKHGSKGDSLSLRPNFESCFLITL